MPSESLLGAIFARGEAAAATSDTALLQALLDVEAALARAAARVGAIPPQAAEEIAAACVAANFDQAALAAAGARDAQPVVALVAALRRTVSANAADYVHHQATSQDIMDSALMLIASSVLQILINDLRSAADHLAGLAAAHAETQVIGRTLLQQALPTTLGLKAVGWMTALDEARTDLDQIRTEVLAVQLGGPVGVLDAPELTAALAAELDLNAPMLPWHTDRHRIGRLAGALGVAAGALAKLAQDVVLLAQNELGELREGGPGGSSSSMAHKHNPTAAISVLACARRTPGLVATLLGVMAQEHERGAGGWQAEWPTLLDLMRLTSSAASWSAELAAGLVVDTDRIAANLAGAKLPRSDAAAAAALVKRALEARAQ